jgi:hypothetical protein
MLEARGDAGFHFRRDFDSNIPLYKYISSHTPPNESICVLLFLSLCVSFVFARDDWTRTPSSSQTKMKCIRLLVAKDMGGSLSGVLNIHL